MGPAGPPPGQERCPGGPGQHGAGRAHQLPGGGGGPPQGGLREGAGRGGPPARHPEGDGEREERQGQEDQRAGEVSGAGKCIIVQTSV